jgi:hypothetical protein
LKPDRMAVGWVWNGADARWDLKPDRGGVSRIANAAGRIGKRTVRSRLDSKLDRSSSPGLVCNWTGSVFQTGLGESSLELDRGLRFSFCRSDSEPGGAVWTGRDV